MVGGDGAARSANDAVERYAAALRNGDFVAALEALEVVATDPASGARLEPPLTAEQMASVRDAATTGQALYNLGAAIWSTDGYELLALDVLAESGVRGSADGIAATGEALVWLGLPENAVGWLESAVREDSPRSAWLRGLLGETLRDHGDGSERSLALLGRAAAAHVEFGVAYAKALRRAGAKESARACLESLVARGVYGAALQLGNLLLDDFDDLTGAERAYREGMSTKDAHSAYNLGLLLRTRGRTTEAAAAFADAKRLGDPTPPPQDD